MDKKSNQNCHRFRFRRGVELHIEDTKDGAILAVRDIDSNFIDPIDIASGIADKLEAEGMSRRAACCIQDDAYDAIVKSMQVEFLRELLEP